VSGDGAGIPASFLEVLAFTALQVAGSYLGIKVGGTRRLSSTIAAIVSDIILFNLYPVGLFVLSSIWPAGLVIPSALVAVAMGFALGAMEGPRRILERTGRRRGPRTR